MVDAMTPAESLEYMKLLKDEFADQFHELAVSYTSGDLALGDFQIEARQLLRDQYAQALVIGAGGDPSAVDPQDYLALGPPLKSQYGYLEDFVNEIDAGELTDAQVEARAALYGSSAYQAFWLERAPFELPQLPGDGGTRCLTNCACHWEFNLLYDADGNPTAVECTWLLGEAEHCPDCQDNAEKWNPLTIPVGPDFDEADLEFAKARHYTFPELERLWCVAAKAFNPDQARDERGRWVGGVGSPSETRVALERARRANLGEDVEVANPVADREWRARMLKADAEQARNQRLHRDAVAEVTKRYDAAQARANKHFEQFLTKFQVVPNFPLRGDDEPTDPGTKARRGVRPRVTLEDWQLAAHRRRVVNWWKERLREPTERPT